MNPKVDEYLRTTKRWSEEMEQLREISLGCSLTETLKWGKPCYTFQNKNVAIIQGFNEFCALLFPKGSLLADKEGLLEKPGENTRAARRIPFKNLQEIIKIKSVIREYLLEAIEVEKAGLKPDLETTKIIELPEELIQKFEENPKLKEAFEALTPGRQRGYNLYFSAPKQSKTRHSRIEKFEEKIYTGKGLNDR